MLSKLPAEYRVLAALGVSLSGCDALVSDSYRGESHLTLAVRVANSPTSSAELLVPALANVQVNEETLRFRPIEIRGEFPASFRMDVIDIPRPEVLAPLDYWLAPDTLVAQEFIAAVVADKLEQTINLGAKAAPLFRDCWNGSCDVQPLPMSAAEACGTNDRACLARQPNCPNGQCAREADRTQINLPEGLEALSGFAQDYIVLYTPEPLPAGSWAARKLGAPEGLAPGYHLASVIEADAEVWSEYSVCVSDAHEAVFARFNEEHGTEYTTSVVDCLQNPIFLCDTLELPNEADSQQLAAAIAKEEVERGCLEIAPEIVPLDEPPEERITVRIGDAPPRWVPKVPLWRSPLAGSGD